MTESRQLQEVQMSLRLCVYLWVIIYKKFLQCMYVCLYVVCDIFLPSLPWPRLWLFTKSVPPRVYNSGALKVPTQTHYVAEK